VGIRCANHVTPLYSQKLALTSPTGGGRSVGMVRSRTKATEFSLIDIINSEELRNSRKVENQSKFKVFYVTEKLTIVIIRTP